MDSSATNIVSRNAVGRPAAMFDYWTNPEHWSNRPVIFVALNPNDLVAKEVEQHADGLKAPQKGIILLNNKELRYIHYRIAERYLP